MSKIVSGRFIQVTLVKEVAEYDVTYSPNESFYEISGANSSFEYVEPPTSKQVGIVETEGTNGVNPLVSGRTSGVIKRVGLGRKHAKTLSEKLKTELDIKTEGGSVSGSVKVFNITEATASFLYNESGDLGKVGDLAQPSIIIDAGYENYHGAIINATVTDIVRYKKGADVITEFFLGQHTTEIDNAMASISVFEDTYTMYDVLIAILDSNKVPYTNNLREAFLDGDIIYAQTPTADFVCHMTLIEFLDTYLHWIRRKYKESKWRLIGTELQSVTSGDPYYDWREHTTFEKAVYEVDNRTGELNIHWAESYMPDTSVGVSVINASSGLIEIPRTDSKKSKKQEKKIKHAMIPTLYNGASVNLELSNSYGSFKEGYYTVSECHYKGNNYEGNHYVECILSNPSGNLGKVLASPHSVDYS